MTSSISIVTPTFNRVGLISKSVNASLDLVAQGVAQELIVVDDASTDGTYEYLIDSYKTEISLGMMQVIRLTNNLGVSGAKNVGAKAASGEYIVFMDSDDQFCKDVGWQIITEISNQSGVDILFFRCVDLKDGHLIGRAEPARMVTLSEMVNGELPGECLPVVKSEVFSALSYPQDLRGGEALLYMSVLELNGTLYLSDIVARAYRTGAQDQLCNRKVIRGPRAKTLLTYNLRLLKYFSLMSAVNKIMLLVRVVLYSYRSAAYAIFKKSV